MNAQYKQVYLVLSEYLELAKHTLLIYDSTILLVLYYYTIPKSVQRSKSYWTFES
jgi:hypothetical protein